MILPKKTFKTHLGGKPITLEISQLAEQANAAVMGFYGQTAVLATVVMSNEDTDRDYLPLTVEFEEKFYAAGKILGSRFMRREGRASENAILSARIIDRTIRPLFDQHIRREIQLVITVISYEKESDPVFIGLLAGSAALAISNVPWNGPVAGVSIKKDSSAGAWQAFIAGTAGKINMIELEGLEAPEQEVVAECTNAMKTIKMLIDFQRTIVAEAGKDKTTVALASPDAALIEKVRSFLADKVEDAMYVTSKMDRGNRIGALKAALMVFLVAEKHSRDDLAAAEHIFEEYLDEVVHKNICDAPDGKEKRSDLRALDEVRPLHTEVGLFERTHGSALFIRGNTQALGLTTLAPPDSAQMIENTLFQGEKHFMFHYNFPPYATGETGSFRGPGRREIGHGALAEKALKYLVPTQDEFPYTIRVVSEILSSNGSSSMASVCAACLSLMDAGVPIKKMVAGIAMGLMTGGQNYKILTDIQGPEDHYGDMDLKVAGTKDGITAVQMDVKIDGITPEILEKALAQAKQARLHIVSVMEQSLAAPRPELSAYAPRVIKITINPEKIGAVVGPGGKVINGIIAKTGILTMDIEQNGDVFIYAATKEAAEAARAQVEGITHEYQVGEIVEGTIVKILDFGAIVEFGVGMDGMIHVSELKDGYVKSVTDIVKLGDFVRAKIIRAENGKIGLSLRGL